MNIPALNESYAVSDSGKMKAALFKENAKECTDLRASDVA
jgi:hypothetical protein